MAYATNYVRGRNFEYSVMGFFRKRGYYCMRAYGSKGLYDIIAIPPFVKEHWFNFPLLIQAKLNGYVKPDERKRLKEKKWQGQVLIAYKEKGRIAFRTTDDQKINIKSLDLKGNDDFGKHNSR